MRAVTAFLFLLANISFASVIPKVPEIIEIAEVKLRITAEAREEIQNEVNTLRASDKYFQIKLDRINLYFPLMEKALQEEGVPDDLKYLAVQESSLISDAVSTSDAVGYWQFKDFTAREVGLRVDSKIDERKNIVSATHGAAKYFKRNNFYFKNWIYSVSAYQAGPGGAKKYVDENNFGSDKLTIDRNTHWYVKRFIAHVIAFKEEVGGPHSEGLRLLVYEKGENKELKEIARDFKVDETMVDEYNKWLKSGTIPSDKSYPVIIPVTGKVKELDEVEPLTRSISEPRDKHTSKSSPNQEVVPITLNGRNALLAGAADDAASLALKGNILERQLLKFNDLSAGAKIQPGLTYYIQSKRTKADVAEHVVQSGETLWAISQKYGVQLKSILKMNRLESAEAIKSGQVIWLNKKRAKAVPVEYKQVSDPEKEEPAPLKQVNSQVLTLRDKPKTELADSTSEATSKEVVIEMEKTLPEPEVIKEPVVVEKPVTKPVPGKEKGDGLYIVGQGETLWGISQKFELTVKELRDLNDLDANAALKPGQELKVKKELFKIYKVEPGDTLYGIARKFGMTVDELKDLNNKTSNSLSLGEELKVKKQM